MAAPTKTAGTVLLAMQTLAAASKLVGAAVDVSTKLAATVHIRCGRNQEAALTVGAKFRVEMSEFEAGDGGWVPVTTFQTAIAAASSEILTAAEAPGQTTLELASTTGLAAGDTILILNTNALNSEFARIIAIANNASITVEEGIINTQTGSTVYDQAEWFSPVMIPETAKRVRVVVDNLGNATQAVTFDAYLCTVDTFE